MARAVALLLALASCATLAKAVYASDSDTKVYTFKFFEQYTGNTQVFGPGKGAGRKGKGYTFDVNLTKTYEPDSELYGYLSGLVFYTSPRLGHEVLTIHFRDIGEKGGTFADAEIFLRGIWNSKSAVQELAIVGGTKGLSGAFGSAAFTEVGDSVFLIQGTIFVDKPSYGDSSASDLGKIAYAHGLAAK